MSARELESRRLMRQVDGYLAEMGVPKLIWSSEEFRAMSYQFLLAAADKFRAAGEHDKAAGLEITAGTVKTIDELIRLEVQVG